MNKTWGISKAIKDDSKHGCVQEASSGEEILMVWGESRVQLATWVL